MGKMKVAVLCEFSGIVRDAFILKGHDAISCDLEPTEKPGPHIQGDCRDYDWSAYDLIIAHPPCTYLSNAGIRWFNEDKYGKKARERKIKRIKAFEFFMYLYNLNCNKIAIENPVGWVNSHFRKPNQIIQPWQFGHDYSKKTCLWLKGLPELKPTKMIQITYITTKSGKKYTKGWYQTPRNSKARSRFFPGIAAAMAEQWGGR